MLMHFYPHMTVEKVDEYRRECPLLYRFMLGGINEYYKRKNTKQ